MTESQQLLAEYARNGSEQAFRQLVERYLNLVYSTALRMTGGNSQLAEDVAQMVFVDLARKAQTLRREVMLGGWLHRDTCFVASKLMRSERRRQSREKQAFEMNALQDPSETKLSQYVPFLDEAINQLGKADRTAILLRFFEQRDLRSVGDALGASENAAQKRVGRALEELRGLLKKRGVALSVTALGTTLGAEAVTAAPAGLGVSISSAALKAATVTPSTVVALKVFFMSKAKMGIVSACVLASLTTSIVIQHEAQARLREQAAVLRQQSEQLARLQAESSDLAQVATQPGDSSTNDRQDLIRLRREVGLLRDQTKALNALPQENQRLPGSQKSPLQRIEESKERGITLMNYTKEWVMAFTKFAEGHDDQLPTSFDEALLFLSDHAKAQTNVSIGQFDIIYQGSRKGLANPSNVMLLREKHAWPNGTGESWARAYAFADGHSEIHRLRDVTNALDAAAADLTFDSWEKTKLGPQSSSP